MILRYERWRWQTFGITWLVYASYYLTRQSFGVAKVALEDAPVNFSRKELGTVDAVYLTTYSAGQFIFGPLADRFGPRRTLLGGMSLSVLAAVGCGFSTTLTAFLVFAVLQGMAQSTGWTGTSKAMSSWFSLRERGRVIGWWCTHYTVGAAIASPFAGWLMDAYSRTRTTADGSVVAVPFWPAAFWGPAAVLAVVMVLAWLLLRNRPEDVGLPPIDQYHGGDAAKEFSESARPADGSSWSQILSVLQTPSVWLLAIAYFPIKLARYSFYFWGPMYVEESLGTSTFTSAMTAACMPIGGMIGVIATGYISDKLFDARRAPVIVTSLLIAAAVMLVGQRQIENVWLMGAFFFSVGVFLYGPDSMISATAAIDFGSKRGAGAATGFVNGVGSMGAILGGYLPGVLTSESNWTAFFAITLGGLVLSAVVLTPLWNTRPPAG